ncbi:hypothetical protein ETAA8_35660 [Anatilimnocola aggregata]|uniref:Uncharacterized protein n=1 Tax=Anatilimnocola aggregata TaxID=2528021 RepID=A0A517YE01_9BACT|nr:hypothetical protein [Anatilimnocola aggregata]QDU28465.1 hypothetical protein ETAA8_35660 [Anatilimnocola aggregata]
MQRADTLGIFAPILSFAVIDTTSRWWRRRAGETVSEGVQMTNSRRLVVTIALTFVTIGVANHSAVAQLVQPLPNPSPRGPELVPPPATPRPAPAVGPVMPEDRPIGQLSATIATRSTDLPPDVATAYFSKAMPADEVRPWRDNVYFWDAPDFCYRPLYYQETNLERYGYSPCPHLQPALSAAHFFAATVALPYSMTVHPSRECVYPLGYYRPGSPAPRQIQWPELQPKAITAETAVAAGLILLIP